jgi:hypothetical protein
VPPASRDGRPFAILQFALCILHSKSSVQVCSSLFTIKNLVKKSSLHRLRGLRGLCVLKTVPGTKSENPELRGITQTKVGTTRKKSESSRQLSGRVVKTAS